MMKNNVNFSPVIDIHLKETSRLQFNHERKQWIDDPYISQYVYFSQDTTPEDLENSLASFNKYYEIYEGDQLVGDIKVFYENEEDIFLKRAQILMVISKRSQGIGTRALKMLLEQLKGCYNSVYCRINRNNIASLKMVKNNGFLVEDWDDEELVLVRHLDD